MRANPRDEVGRALPATRAKRACVACIAVGRRACGVRGGWGPGGRRRGRMLVQRSPGRSGDPRPPDVSFAPPGQSAASANGDRSRLVGDVTRHPAPQSRYEHAATGRDTWPRRLVPRNAREAPRVSRVSPCGGGHVASEATGGRGVDAADACSFSEVPAAAATPRPPDASLRHRGNPRRPPRAYASSRALAVYQSRRAFCESTGSGPGTARS